MLKSKIILIGIIGCFICLSPFFNEFVLAQETEPEQPDEVNEEEIKENRHIETLDMILQDINEFNKDIKSKERELRSAKTKEEKLRIREEISNFTDELDILEQNFNKIATSIDVSVFEEKPQKEFKWEEEVSELLRPVVQEIKGMTAGPRQTEKLRRDMTYYETRLPIIKKAVKNIETLMTQVESKKLRKQLKHLKKSWTDKEQQFSNQLAVARLQLEELAKARKPFWESAQTILKLFFKSRGKNLFFALVSFLSVFLILRLIHRGIYKFSPIHKAEERPFYVRLCDVFYHLLTGAGSVFAFLAVLYTYGDWVLLTLAVFFILGFVWTAKENFSRFWEEIKLLLNLGSVRENERLIYQGVPWKVNSLNLYTELENPVLKNKIKLSLRELTTLNSYPYQKNDPWFPCKENDWVILADETRGQVISQSHDMVRLCLRGESYKTYLTGDFLSLSPHNISEKFRLKVTFGIDYRHQAICTSEVPEMLGKFVEEKLRDAGYGDDLISLRVDFKSAAASSLDFEIIADFSGRVAEFYQRLNRNIQSFAVDACNAYGWEIPFTQITLHNAEGPGEG
ncbi:hypothetical protein [Desulfonema magnum]|uniref:Mechanosensitive ion channel n=1 Tax=Desulfonema magnum TaxID=45655 RepID=A0A975BQP8_9BACT|nr:hypothetical protein [Desulfonema magnum]QTA89320.1 Uncharacterized protein dnm_053700 [Desulfonema magnum]